VQGSSAGRQGGGWWRGGKFNFCHKVGTVVRQSLHSDPRWVIPIRAHIREANQARAIKPEQDRIANGEDATLRAANGVRTQGSSITMAARENVCQALYH